MLTNDLFNTDYERRLAEGAVDQLEQRRIDDLNMKMDELANRVKSTTDKAHRESLLKAFLKCKEERDGYYKIKEGEITKTPTGIKHRSTSAYGGTQDEPDHLARLDKHAVNRADKALGVKFDREKKYQGGLDIDEAGIGQDIVNRTEKMARATPPTKTDAVASTVKNAAKWLAGKGGPGREGPTYEGQDDAWSKEEPWTKVPKNKAGQPVDPRGEVAHLSDVARREAERKAQDPKKKSKEVDEGFQDFNKVEPYAVCLAGRPVKKFDYYEDARRFHDNWKKKLYNAGDKAKADKITLMPLNLDEGRGFDDLLTPYEQGEASGLSGEYYENPFVEGSKSYTEFRQGWRDGTKQAEINRDIDEAQINEYFVRSGDDIASVFSLNLFKDLLGDTSLSNHDEEFANSPEWQAVVATWAPKAEHIQKEIYKYQNIGRKLRDAEADAIDATVYDGSDAYENAETAASYLPKVYNKQASAIVRLLKDGFANPPEGMHEDDGRVTSDGPIRLPTSPTIEPNSDYWTTEWPKEVRRKKQELLKDFSQNAKLVEIEWAFEHKAFMSKEQILDYLDQTINDPELTPLEYMHNNGYSTDSMLKGMLKWLFTLGLSKADIFGIIKSARRGNTDVSPAMISRVARQALRTEMTEDQAFVPAVGDEIMWRPKNAKMVPTPVTVVATTPDKLKIKLQSPGMIQRAGKDTIVVGINNSDIFSKPVDEAANPAQQAAIAVAMKKAHKKPATETRADPTGSWVVYGGNKVMKFKTHTGAKAYAEKNGGKVASSEFYADKIQGVTESAMSNVHAAMADVYNRLAPGIERNRDSFKAGQLYDELENIAELHGIEPEFKRMMNNARNRAHMEYDTNPGGFQNWFWFLPFGDDIDEGMYDTLGEEQDTSGVESAIIRRIMVAHKDWLVKFGPQKVMQAAEEVAYNVGDVDEIGTSDVSAYVHQVGQILGAV